MVNVKSKQWPKCWGPIRYSSLWIHRGLEVRCPPSCAPLFFGQELSLLKCSLWASLVGTGDAAHSSLTGTWQLPDLPQITEGHTPRCLMRCASVDLLEMHRIEWVTQVMITFLKKWMVGPRPQWFLMPFARVLSKALWAMPIPSPAWAQETLRDRGKEWTGY